MKIKNRDDKKYYEPAKVVIRFREGINLKGPNLERQIDQQGIGQWEKLVQDFPNLKLSPVFQEPVHDIINNLNKRAVENDPTYRPIDFSVFYYIDAPSGTDLVSLVKVLLRWNSIKEAYIDQSGPDPVVNAGNDPRSSNQGYLDPAPDGIDAEYAWGITGGDGAHQRFIDLERGWTLNHEDLVAHGATLLHGVLLNDSRPHGSSVLGEVCAVDNTTGCVGIVPNIDSVNVVSFNGSTRPQAIIAAIQNLSFGDVLLLEAQVTLNGTSLYGPIEAYDLEYEAIRLATALGIIVIEAGGNGTNNGSTPPLNMDTYTTLSGLAILNRDPTNHDFRDSGAIIVTAASSTAPHTRLAWAPHGKRIDCYAWGENINTLSSDSMGSTNMYTTGFGGTSGASPIITGAALAVQGRAQEQLHFRFSPRQMRKILSDPANGTARASTETTQISVMPNLRNIFINVFNVAPDIYIRDFVGDTGEPHTGSISASPDVILRPTSVSNPQTAFGAGSGTENDSTLGYTAEIGQDNYIYVRMLNQGGSVATNVEATVFWSPVATLVTPNLWTLVGTTTIPSVPVGEQLTVSNAIVWPQLQIPAEGHYCFVCLIGNPSDPAPGPADFLNWDNFRRFIRENNNVTWRNFNVENNDPDVEDPTVPTDYKALKFLATGAPDKARYMDLETNIKLPEKAKAILEVPLVFFETLHEYHQFGEVKTDKKRSIVLIPLNHHGHSRLGRVLFPAKSRTLMRLLIYLPKENRKESYQLSVRQLWNEEEIGRITWQLQPANYHQKYNTPK